MRIRRPRRYTVSSPNGRHAETILLLTNQEIAACLDDVADLLEVQGVKGFRVRAYRTIAGTLRGSGAASS
jgi:hypothetical protein